MRVCRSRGESGRARHRNKQVRSRIWVLGSAFTFFHGARAKTQSIGQSKAQAHCLAPEGSPLDRFHV